MDDKVNGATAASSPGPIYEFLAIYRYYPLAGVPFCLVLMVFGTPKVLRKVSSLIFLTSFAFSLISSKELLRIKYLPQTLTIFHVNDMTFFR